MSARSAAAFVSAGYSTVDRHSDRGILAYALDAAVDALDAAGIDRDEVDGYVGIAGSPNPGAGHVDGADHVTAYLVADALGLGRLGWASDVSGFAVGMAAGAAQAIAAGECRCVLGVRAVHHAPGARGAPAVSGDVVARGTDLYRLPFGAGPGGTRFAVRAQRYLELSGARREDLWHVVHAAREHARANPVAVFRDKELTRDAYLDAPLTVEPLGLYDCDMPVCGAGAFVMVSAEKARRSGRPAAYLRGWTNWTDSAAIFERSGVARRDIQVCQLYDGYSPMLYEWLERLGWCDPYTAWKFVADGHTAPGGALPVNTFGGALGEGRLHGMGHLREGIVQVLGTAGARQVPGVRNCLVQIGPYDRSALAVLSTEPGGDR
ncbi:thiolase family protein [Streptomyces sp. NPDC088747]|uniref:thiolase family protein n=1 Tax=Streptomyces sp. NPDC088747 TaxID=3365886 RepID=UPI0037F755E3